jgi:hypothetical protein
LQSIGRHNAVLYAQPGLSEPKKVLIKAVSKGFDHVTGSMRELADLPPEMIPCVGCQFELQELEEEWIRKGRTFVYWDRGYLNRGGITWMKRRSGPEYFRWHVSRYQMGAIREDAPAVRLEKLGVNPRPWRKEGKRIIIAAPSPHYEKFHRIEGWTVRTREDAKRSGRPVFIRQKSSRVPLDRDLLNAHCLITHGSVAAIEAVVWGCPVIVDPSSAAAPVGQTSCDDIENLVTPDRTAWLRSIAASQFSLSEIADGTMLRSLSREVP